MPFVVFKKGEVCRASFPPNDVVKKVQSNEDAIEENAILNAPYQVRIESVLHDVLFHETLPNLKQLAKDADIKIEGGKMEIVKVSAEKLCDCSDSPSDPVQGLKDAVEKVSKFEFTDRIVLTIWIGCLVRGEFESLFRAGEVVYEKGTQDLKDFLVWYAPFHGTIDHRELMKGMDKATVEKSGEASKPAFIGKEEAKAFTLKRISVEVSQEIEKLIVFFDVGKSATGADLHSFFCQVDGLNEGDFVIRFGTAEGSSRLEKYMGIHAYAENDQVFTLHLLQKGGGMHTKLKKNLKLEHQKQDFNKKSEKAIGGAMATDLLQQAEAMCVKMIGDNTGNFMKQLLFQKSIAELEAMKDKIKNGNVGRALRQMTGDFLTIHKDLISAKEKIGLALDAMESAFEFQLIQCFYSDESQRFHYPSYSMIDAIIEFKSAMPRAEQQMAD